jgi:hypothetical protein
MRLPSALLLVVSLTVCARSAGADSLPVDEVEIVSDEPLDVEALRTAVAAAMGRSGAGGKVSIVIAAGRVRVRFSAPNVERTVDLEKDPDARIKQITLLAENLVGRESEELAPPRAPAAVKAPDVDRAEEDYARLDATLRYHAEVLERSAPGIRIATSVYGLTALATGVYTTFRLREPLVGVPLMLNGALFGLAFVPVDDGPAHLRKILHTRRKSDGPVAAIAETERAWQEEADSSRRWRKIFGATAMAAGAVGVGMGVGLIVTAKPDASRDDGRIEAGALAMVISSLAVTAGAAEWFTPSPYERYLEQYRRTKRVEVSVVPFGAGLALVGNF